MHTSADTLHEQKSQAAANSSAQKKSDPLHTAQYTDVSPEALAQSDLQEMANNGPQAKQAATLQAMANQYVARQHPPVKDNQQAAQLKSAPAGPPVVQRALEPGDKATFLEWVEAQFVEKGIKAKFRAGVMRAAEDAAGSRVIATVDAAKARMTAEVFPRFEARSALTDLAGRANRSEGITIADVEAVLVYLGNARTAAFLGAGQTVHLRMLPAGDLEKNCHHYAFGGLKGADTDFNFGRLQGLLKLDTAANGANINASDIPGVENSGPITVRNYGVAHSSREEGGKVWHKFVGVPCLFAIDEFPDLGNDLVKTFSVRSSAATVTGVGTFNLGPPEEVD